MTEAASAVSYPGRMHRPGADLARASPGSPSDRGCIYLSVKSITVAHPAITHAYPEKRPPMMIRLTNLTAVQTAVNPQPLPPKSLVAKIGRLGDSVSLNPQPLPPKAVAANVKAGLKARVRIRAPQTQRRAAGQPDRFLTASAGSSLTAPAVTLRGLHGPADGFLQHEVGASASGGYAAIKSSKGSILAGVLKTLHQVDQLTKAENLMEDAYARMSNPNRNEVETLRAHEEMAQALQIRKSVMPELSKYQQEALWSISDIEQRGILDAGDNALGQTGAAYHEQGKKEFQLGVQENQSLIKWILS